MGWVALLISLASELTVFHANKYLVGEKKEIRGGFAAPTVLGTSYLELDLDRL